MLACLFWYQLSALFMILFILQNFLNAGRGKRQGKSSFVEHRTFFHLYHSFHRLWIFLVMMLQVCNLLQLFILTFFVVINPLMLR